MKGDRSSLGDMYIIPSQVVHRLLVTKGPMKVLDIFSPPARGISIEKRWRCAICEKS